MKTYKVKIQATITKTLLIQAENEEKASAQAYEQFDSAMDNNEERYEQGILSVEREF